VHMLKKDNLPPSCPMLKADYEHYCSSPTTGPDSYERTGMCFKQDECTKIVNDFKKMGIKHTSEVIKVISE
jgi:hypothetical protein